MATADGTVKKTPLVNFSRPRSTGLIALSLDEGDTLIGAAITDGTAEVMLVSSQGKSIRFAEDDVRPMGRTARGVRGIKLQNNARVISLIIPQETGRILTTSINGYGKQTDVEDFPTYGRGGQGVIAMQCTDRNGELIGAVQMFEGDDVMLISDQGTLVRTRSDEISVLGRNTQGVRVIRVAADENLVGVARIEEPEVSEDELTETDFTEGEADQVVASDDSPSGPAEAPDSDIEA